MYRLVPFKNLTKDLQSARGDAINIYTSCLRSGEVLIQDTEDMVVERFTVSKLRKLEETDKAYFHCFQLTPPDYDNEIYENAYKQDGFFILDGEATPRINKEVFLHGRLKIETDSISSYDSFSYVLHSFLNNKAGTGVDGWYWEFAYILTLDESKTCKIRTCYWENNNNEAYLLLVVNNKVICYLDTDLASEYDEEVYLDLLQVCKTKAGFDLVFSIGHDIHKFFGVRLDKDLNLVDLTNITPIFEKEYEKTSPEIRKILAKSKLLEA